MYCGPLEANCFLRKATQRDGLWDLDMDFAGVRLSDCICLCSVYRLPPAVCRDQSCPAKCLVWKWNVF